MAVIFDQRYVLEKEGFGWPHINIIEMNSKKLLGKITYPLFRERAKVQLGDENYTWKFDNISYSKWSVRDDQDKVLIQTSSRKEGAEHIESQKEALLLISGLCIRNKYYRSGYY